DLSSKADMQAINNWVKEKTKGLIPTLHNDPYPESTMLVLLNALYMNAKWQRPFEGWRTHESAFTTADGEEIQTQFMSMDGNLLYIDTEDAKGILLPYKDERLSFIALLPDEDMSDYVSSLTGEKLLSAVQSSKEEFAHLRLPKFDFEYDRSFTDDLAALGLGAAFDPDLANFIPMGSGPNGELYLSEVYQKVKIIVDEEGTEAAAVTEAAATEEASMEEPIPVYFDRPFLYAVVETETGLPLFLGAYDMPA
ncbi:MAG: serine protease, partial [Clostridia bacterium]|nr:serine protease [Clostridia bacterium]